MPTLTERLTTVVETAESDGDLFSQIINGDAETTVTVGDDVEVSTIAKAVADASASITGAAYFTVTAVGLVATVGAGKIFFDDGSSVSVASQTVNLKASATNYIVIRLDATPTAHTFYRAIDSSCVHVATIVAGASTVTSIVQKASLTVPKSGTTSFNTRLRDNKAVKVLLIGDSLSYGAGTAPFFFDLVFSTVSGTTYNVPNIANCTLTRKGAPGASAIWGMIMTADIIGLAPSASNWYAASDNNQCNYLGQLSNEEANAPYSFIGPNRYAATLPDLVIICLGTNYASGNIEELEAQIRFWRSKGCEVVASFGIQRFDGGTTTTALDTTHFKAICEANGASIWDVDAPYMEARNNNASFGGTNPTNGDLVHFSAYGQTIAASSLLAVVCPAYYQSAASRQLPLRRSFTTTPGSSPHGQLALHFPFSTGTGLGTTVSIYDNLRSIFGGYSTANGVVTIPSAAYVECGFPIIGGSIYAIVENQGGDNFNWSTKTVNGATTIQSGTVTGASIPFQIVEIVSAANVQTYGANSFYSATVNKALPVALGLRFQVTSGTARLAGIFYKTPILEEVPLTEAMLKGTWADETSDTITGTRVITTNTLNDAATIRVSDCDGLCVMLRTGQSAGIIRATVNGIVAHSAQDFYGGAIGTIPLLAPLCFVPGAWPNYAGDTTATKNCANAKTSHVLNLRYTALNGSAAAVIEGAGRLTITKIVKLTF